MSSASQFFSSFRYSFGGQLVSRICSFGVNIYLLRTVNKTVLGVANVRLTLLYTTVLFLVREPFRKACLEADEKKENEGTKRENFARLVNLLWLCPVLSIAIGALLSAIWTFCLVRPDELLVPNYTSAVGFFWLSTVIEACAEPFWILCQRFQLVGHVALVQSVHVFLQRIIVAGLVIAFPNCDLSAFCIAQVGASIVYLLLFLLRLMQLIGAKDERVSELRSVRDLFPRLQAGVDIRRRTLVRSFFGHSLLKQTLTDGAGYIMTFFNVISFGDQAVYDAIERLGSLVARIVLAPLEESAYVYFSQNIKRHLSAEKQEEASFQTATSVLFGLLRVTCVLGLVVCTFGMAYSRLLLSLYGGDLLSSGSGPTMLKCYSAYVLLLALNGITECFAFATMSNDEVIRHGRFMVGSSVAYLLLHLALSTMFGGLGFIMANCLNMIARILYSLHYIRAFYRNIPEAQPMTHLIPTASTAGILFASLLFTLLSELIFCCNGFFNAAAHVTVGAAFLLFTGLVIYSSDFALVTFCERFIFLRRKTE